MKMRFMSYGLLCLLLAVTQSSADENSGIYERIAEQSGIAKPVAKQQVETVFEAIKEELKEGRSVTVRTFGRFYAQKRAARKGRNPATGQEIEIPSKRYPKFSSSDSFKKYLN
jgi:DNA-binding protein HU-beta